ncbi:MAG: DUF4442 domain-containing protein [Saprospiraceae bacterium]
MPETTITKAAFNANAPAVQTLLRNLNTPWKMRLYYLQKLPSLYFWGVRIKSCNENRAEVSIPFSWRSQNPFRSTYFAALCGAAELSTGVLALIGLAGREKVSMLVTQVEAQYFKKADATVTFTCEQGTEIIGTIDQAIASGAPQQFTATSTGRLPNGDLTCQMQITWSFKAKK